MARELRALLLWGRRLRAPALAAARAGEGGRTGGRGRVCVTLRGPEPASFSERRGYGTLCVARETVRFMRQTHDERRMPSLRCVLVPQAPALPRCPQEETRLSPSPCDYSRGFSSGRVRQRGRGLFFPGAEEFRRVKSEDACALGTDFSRLIT